MDLLFPSGFYDSFSDTPLANDRAAVYVPTVELSARYPDDLDARLQEPVCLVVDACGPPVDLESEAKEAVHP